MKAKKISLINFFFFILFCGGCGQVFYSTQQKQPDQMQTNKFLKEWELPEDTKKSWDSLFNVFIETKFF